MVFFWCCEWFVLSVSVWMDSVAPYFDVVVTSPSWAAAGPAAVTSQNWTFLSHSILSFFSPFLTDYYLCLSKRGNKLFTSSQAAGGVSHICSISTARLLFFCFFSPLPHSLLHLWTLEALEQMWLQTSGLNTHLHATPVCTVGDRRSASHLFLNKAELCVPPKHFCKITHK